MISRVKQSLSEKLKNFSYRHKFFSSRVQDEIATQIQILRERRQFRQIDLAKRCSMKQAAISRIEKADYASWNFQTLLRVAEGLDARLRVVFEPAEDVIRDYELKEKGARSIEEFHINYSPGLLFCTIPSRLFDKTVERDAVVMGNAREIRGVCVTGPVWSNISDTASTSSESVSFFQEHNVLLTTR